MLYLWRRSALTSCAAALLVAGLLTASAQAAGTLVADNRLLDVAAAASESGSTTSNDPAPVVPVFGAMFDEVLDSLLQESLPLNRAEASADASQTSSFDASPDFLTVIASGYSHSYGKINSFTGVNDAQSDSDSVFSIEFSVSAATPWSISAGTDDEGSGSTGRVRLHPVGGDDIFILQGTGTLQDTASGVLDPGNYELIGEARTAAFVSTDLASFQDREAAFNLEFRLVPEPASGVLMLLGCCALLRRRGA
ncbi:MAG TPA: PEP-CTERM sorting domain-containing protein [Phycisphaerae bacterium]|nr:PEP-CTERM sorting domain-containing protein [Phycisphaerae bacterium]